MTSSSPRLGLLLLTAVLVQTVAVTITVLHFTSALNAMKETFARSSVSCLTLSESDLSRSDPCSQVTQQLHTLIQKSLSQRYQRQISSASECPADEVSRFSLLWCWTTEPPHGPEGAAHVTGSFVSKPSRDAAAAAVETYFSPSWLTSSCPGQKISWWEGQRGLAFLQDVQLHQGELVVSRPGLYYIYAQIYFRHHQGEPEEPEGEAEEERGERGGRPLLQYVYKKVSSYPVPILLMKTSRTSCWSRGSEFSLHSAHQGGCSLWPQETDSSSPSQTLRPWTWTRGAASSGLFSSAKLSKINDRSIRRELV
ncbi:hypothetical protein WMY93_029949 [Mugilogobius chulae]|uniref:THD domain-containing protein n=1 Tax=Mugilogobius chulae TaxID=88201 RepID=A0AAW0MPZ3_9GOBI